MCADSPRARWECHQYVHLFMQQSSNSDGDLADVTANTSLPRAFRVREGLRGVFKGKRLIIEE